MIKVALVYPCDPLGSNIGGIESFIKCILEAAPANISYEIIGATTDATTRPVGQWTRCEYRGKVFNYFPLYAVKNPAVKPRIPATLIYELMALLRMPSLDADIIESHRVEHLLLRRFAGPSNLFVHKNMAVLQTEVTEDRWKFAPGLYKWLESKVLYRTGNVFCVREDAVQDYQRNYPEIKDKFHFQPTCMDAEKYHPLAAGLRVARRCKLLAELGLDSRITTAVTVCRIELVKDPMMMLDAIDQYIKKGNSIQLIWVGDGILRGKVEKKLKLLKLEGSVKLIGSRKADEIASLLQVADLFLMSSADEGMPIAVLEALACGCPVASTVVGEVSRLVTPGVNGYLAEPGNADLFCQAIENLVTKLPGIAGPSCFAVAEQYTCHKVLSDVYEGYARLVGRAAVA